MRRKWIWAVSGMVAISLIIVIGFYDHNSPSGVKNAGPPPVSTFATLPPGFTSATSVVESLNQIYSTPTTRSPGSTWSSPGTASPSDNPVVSYDFAGSCSAQRTTFNCHIAVEASDGLRSAGYVTAYPSVRGAGGCTSSEPLDSDVAIIEGTCTMPYAQRVLAVYSLTPGTSAPRLATSYVSWS